MTSLLPLARLAPHVSNAELTAWEKVFPLGQEVQWEPNKTVFPPKRKVLGLHFVLSGRFRCYSVTQDGKQRTLWIMHEHSLIGDVALFNDTVPIYLMESETAARTIFFSRKVLWERVIPNSPEVALCLLKMLALKVRWQSSDAYAQNFLPSWKRLGSFLFDASEAHKNNIAISHADMAEFLGMHRVTVTKALARLRRMGLIYMDQRGIHIVDKQRFFSEVLEESDDAVSSRPTWTSSFE
ncbi:MAG: Crp/Fnr family transcriptional regulator [Mailhella sp.]|nr:Crp/Fnr family transcriptional regulator [Mailhella sp.]